LHHGGALVHVSDRFARFLLNSLDEFGNFLGGLRGFLGQLTDFLGDHRKAQAVFAGAGRFDGGVSASKLVVRRGRRSLRRSCRCRRRGARGADDFGGSLDGGAGAVQAFGGLFHGEYQSRPLRESGGRSPEASWMCRRRADGGDHLIDRR